MKHIYYDIERDGVLGSDDKLPVNTRWIEPPTITYFVTTTDKYGNINVSPISLGTHMGFNATQQGGHVGYFSFSLVHVENTDSPEEMNRQLAVRDTENNLEYNRECVISYCTKHQMKEMRITGCPIPRGLDEGEIAGLTYFEAKKVAPPCIQECPVNMEAKVVHSKLFGVVKLYVCEVVALHVDEYFDKLDKQTTGHPGLILTEPIFEIVQEGELYFGNQADQTRGNFRMNMAAMGPDTPLLQEPANIGPRRKWIGTFTMWMEDELSLGNITQEEQTEIMTLYANWLADKNPASNGHTKQALTAWIKDIVWNRNIG